MGDIDVEDRDIRSTVEAFEAARTARETELTRPELRRILLVLDGSNQDPTSEDFARLLALRSDAEILVTWAHAGVPSPDLKTYLEGRNDILQEAGAGSRVLLPSEESLRPPPFEQIAAAARSAHCDLVVVCAPYREDFEDLGTESVGSTLDILMARSPVPVLAVREPKREAEACLRRALLPLTPVLKTSAEAAGWALFLAKGGAVELLAISPDSPPEEEGAPQRVAAALHRPEEAGLIAAVQRRAAEEGIDCRVNLHRGEGLPPLTEAANAAEQIVVVPCCPRDPQGSAYQRMQALLRASRNPLLVV